MTQITAPSAWLDEAWSMWTAWSPIAFHCMMALKHFAWLKSELA